MPFGGAGFCESGDCRLTIFLETSVWSGSFVLARIHLLRGAYSTLTRLPRTHRASVDEAILFPGVALDRLTPVGLEAGEYAVILRDAAVAGVSGGALYDFLISRCALLARAEILYSGTCVTTSGLAIMRREL